MNCHLWFLMTRAGFTDGSLGVMQETGKHVMQPVSGTEKKKVMLLFPAGGQNFLFRLNSSLHLFRFLQKLEQDGGQICTVWIMILVSKNFHGKKLGKAFM